MDSQHKLLLWLLPLSSVSCYGLSQTFDAPGNALVPAHVRFKRNVSTALEDVELRAERAGCSGAECCSREAPSEVPCKEAHKVTPLTPQQRTEFGLNPLGVGHRTCESSCHKIKLSENKKKCGDNQDRDCKCEDFFRIKEKTHTINEKKAGAIMCKANSMFTKGDCGTGSYSLINSAYGKCPAGSKGGTLWQAKETIRLRQAAQPRQAVQAIRPRQAAQLAQVLEQPVAQQALPEQLPDYFPDVSIFSGGFEDDIVAQQKVDNDLRANNVFKSKSVTGAQTDCDDCTHDLQDYKIASGKRWHAEGDLDLCPACFQKLDVDHLNTVKSGDHKGAHFFFQNSQGFVKDVKENLGGYDYDKASLSRDDKSHACKKAVADGFEQLRKSEKGYRHNIVDQGNEESSAPMRGIDLRFILAHHQQWPPSQGINFKPIHYEFHGNVELKVPFMPCVEVLAAELKSQITAIDSTVEAIDSTQLGFAASVFNSCTALITSIDHCKKASESHQLVRSLPPRTLKSQSVLAALVKAYSELRDLIETLGMIPIRNAGQLQPIRHAMKLVSKRLETAAAGLQLDNQKEHLSIHTNPHL